MTIREELSAAQQQAILDTQREQMEHIAAAARPGAVAIDREFVFFAAFDGTNNDLANHGNAQNTNVAQLYQQAQLAEARHPNLSANYYPGPGTPGTLDHSAWMHHAVTQQVTAAAERACTDFAERARAWLGQHPGGRLAAVIASFSRGGASAAIFARLLHDRGLVDAAPGDGSLVPPGGARIAAGVLLDPVMTGVECDLDYPPDAANLLQIRAQDEYRYLFRAADYSGQSCVTTVDMLGNHCDIGGSYDNGIAALTLEAATDYLQRCGVPVDDAPAARRFAGVAAIAIHSEEFDDFGNHKWDVYDRFASVSIRTPSPRRTLPVTGRSRSSGGKP